MTDSPEISKTSRDMTQGSPGRHIFFFSLPLFASSVFQQLYNVVDSVVVGRYVGENALAGVGTSQPVILLLTSLFAGIGLGASALLSQYYGAGDREKVRQLVHTIYSLFVCIVVPLTVLGIVFSGPMLRLINTPTDGQTFEMAQTYMIIIMAGLLPSFGFNLNAGLLLGVGNSIVPFVSLLVATVLNVGLDILFVGGLGWGTAGAAWATVIAQSVSWIWGIVYINRHYTFMKLKLKFVYHKEIFRAAMKMGLPSGLNQSLFAAGTLVMQGLINRYGTSFVAGFTGASRVETFAFFPIQSFATAVTTFVAQNIGAGKIERAHKGARAGFLMAAAASLAVPALVLPFARETISLFLKEDSSAYAIQSGADYLNRIMPFFFVLSCLWMVNALLRGAGQMMVPMISTLISLLIVRLPLAYWFADEFGASNMYYSFGIGWGVGLVISVGYYLSGRWKKQLFVHAARTLE